MTTWDKDKAVIDRPGDLKNWAALFRQFISRNLEVYAYANNQRRTRAGYDHTVWGNVGEGVSSARLGRQAGASALGHLGTLESRSVAPPQGVRRCVAVATSPSESCGCP